MIIFSGYGVRGREQPLVPLSHLTQSTAVYNEAKAEGCMRIAVPMTVRTSLSERESERASERTNERASKHANEKASERNGG